jgi:uncharacterized protein YggU (UPF0235/DUF167 family)
MDKGTLAHLAVEGSEFAVRVTPGAAQDRIAAGDRAIRIHVTAPPEDGRATRAAQVVLARALGVAKSRLVLLRGATSRDKVFRLD